MRLKARAGLRVRCPDGRVLTNKVRDPGDIAEITVPDTDTFWIRRLRDKDVRRTKGKAVEPQTAEPSAEAKPSEMET